jgi:hypothetical protein
MSQSLEDQLVSYAREHAEDGILLDTNVLLLLLVAQFRPDLVGGKRLETYGLRDAELLTAYVKNFTRILTTPHVLAETSNFIRQIMKGKTQSAFLTWLHPMFCLDDKGALVQCVVQGRDIDAGLFIRLGLTDSGLVASARKGRLLLTSDLNLHVAVVSSGAHSINFTHMREAAALL